jgi:hypothetical protein
LIQVGRREPSIRKAAQEPQFHVLVIPPRKQDESWGRLEDIGGEMLQVVQAGGVEPERQQDDLAWNRILRKRAQQRTVGIDVGVPSKGGSFDETRADQHRGVGGDVRPMDDRRGSPPILVKRGESEMEAYERGHRAQNHTDA